MWRQAELTVALNRTGARAIVTAARIDGINHADLAMNAAAEAFSIRHVCGFGTDLPEGMASLDQAIDLQSTTTRPVVQDGRKACLLYTSFGIALASDAGKAWAKESYALAMHGEPALPADFTHMPYVNPDAPKGGRLVQGLSLIHI